MLAGTVYFYKNDEIIKEMDMEDFYEFTKDEFMMIVKELQADIVMLESFSNNHQIKGSQTILYEKHAD